MSLHYPRRVKDLPSWDIESDDDFNTPQKEQKNNDAVEQTSESHDNNSINSQRMYPKRSSELPKLESDSELDESQKDDNLNCAILNDSFILSPCLNEQKDGRLAETPAGKLLKQVAAYANEDFSATSSLIKKFKEINFNEYDQPPQFTNSKQSLHPYKLESIQEYKQEDFNLIEQTANTNTKRRPIQTPYKTATKLKSTPALTASKSSLSVNASKSLAAGVPANTSEAQFATPQIRTFSVRQRPMDLCSTQSQKSRSAMLNEFRSQKVLFQTPIALSRAPLACLPNDSVTLSLCDTISESGSAPNTVEKSPLKEESKEISGKTKKSLENAFAAADTRQGKENIEIAEQIQAKISEPTPSQSKQSIVTINNVDYSILKKLGCGGSSSVYLAKRKDNNEECALKVVNLHGDPIAVKGYMNETQLLAKLQGNLCVVALFDYQLLQKESKLLVVMEKGESDLQKILQGYTTNLPLYILVNYLYQMLQAVNYIHQNGVIHSDLKPANFLMVHGRLKLIDFGIASNIAIDSTSIIKFSQAGTYNYISPEALTDTSTGTSPMRSDQPKIKISTKSDVWSLGCILYLFLYKKTPFSHIKNVCAKINAISNPSTTIEYPAVPSYYPVMLIHMVKNCLQHNPKQRPSCAELLQYPFHMVIPLQNLIVPTKVSAGTKQTQL